jgi:hypothetical protein
MPHRIESQFVRSIIVPKTLKQDFLIVVCDFEEDIAKNKAKPSTIHPKSLNPNQQHDQYTVHRGEKTQTKLSCNPETPSTKRVHNDAAKSRRQAMQIGKR